MYNSIIKIIILKFKNKIKLLIKMGIYQNIKVYQ